MIPGDVNRNISPPAYSFGKKSSQTGSWSIFVQCKTAGMRVTARPHFKLTQFWLKPVA